jgi:hypothetical protein
MRTFFCEPLRCSVGLCVEKPGFWIPRGLGFFRELRRGEAVLTALPDVATLAIEPLPEVPLAYGLPLASVIEMLPPANGDKKRYTWH